MMNFEKLLSNNFISRRVLFIFIICFTAILFVVTGWTQFSCYPMVTNGVLPKFCHSQKNLLKIIKEPKTHGSTLMILASLESDETVLRTLTFYLNSPKVANNVKILQSALAFNPNTPVDVLDAFVKSEDVGILENIAKRSNTTPEVLREIANNPYADAFAVQKALVENPRISEDVLQKLAMSKELDILWEIVKLKQESSSVLREVYSNPIASNIEIQRLLAWNPNTPKDVLQNLANSIDSRILSYVINHPSANISILEEVGNNPIIWNDINIGLQRTLAEKANISRQLIEKLAFSEDRKILETFYYDNPSVPPEIKEEYRLKLRIVSPPDTDNKVENFQYKTPQQTNISENPFSKNNKPNCPGKHIRNNLIGGAAAAVGFLLSGPVGALAAYSTVTGSLETVTSVSECQF